MFKYEITDRTSGHAAYAFVRIIVPPPAHTALPDVYLCPFNYLCTPSVPVTANDSSPSGGQLSVGDILQPPSSGSLVWKPDGVIEFTPKE